MSSASLTVILGGLTVGEVRRGVGNELQFRYAPEYAADPYSVPLSVCMPLTRRVHPHRLISPWLWGLLPDDVLDRVASLAARLPDAFEEAAADPAVRDISGEFADGLTERVALWQAQCLIQLEADRHRAGRG